MKQLQNNFTTPEQSKVLLDLGLPIDSADCYYIEIDEAMPMFIPFKETFSEYQKSAFGMAEGHYWTNPHDGIIPCWTVGRLIEIYEVCVNHGERFGRWDTKIPIVDDIIERFVRITNSANKEQLDINFSKLED